MSAESSTNQPPSISRDLWGKIPPLVEPGELENWIIAEDEDILAINKPGWLVCHPSKNGPCSSLVGAVRTYLGYEKLHLVSRLDRETSGIILFAKNAPTARRLQMALQNRTVEKVYHALLSGELHTPVTIRKPLVADKNSLVHVKQRALEHEKGGGVSAETHFVPLLAQNGHTLCRILPVTGRKHQIRVHAQALGHALVGDKLYGPDEFLYLKFIEEGWTAEHQSILGFQRQALHASCLTFSFPDGTTRTFEAPLTTDILEVIATRLQVDLDSIRQYL